MDLLDTAGNIAFPAMRRLSITTAHGFVLVFSITSQASFLDVQKLWTQIKEERSNYQDIPCVLVGAMTDLENSRQVRVALEGWVGGNCWVSGFLGVGRG